MNNIKHSKTDTIEIENHIVKTKSLMLCQYCNFATVKEKLMKCTGRKCKINICKNCATFINGKPFCNNCVVEMVRHDSVLIVTRGKI